MFVRACACEFLRKEHNAFGTDAFGITFGPFDCNGPTKMQEDSTTLLELELPAQWMTLPHQR